MYTNEEILAREKAEQEREAKNRALAQEIAKREQERRVSVQIDEAQYQQPVLE